MVAAWLGKAGESWATKTSSFLSLNRGNKYDKFLILLALAVAVGFPSAATRLTCMGPEGILHP